MKRHLRKAIFLPANIKVLADSEFVGPKFIEVTRGDFYDLPLWKRLLALIFPKIGRELILDPSNERNFQGSIWKAIANFKRFGYEVILYPENNTSLNPEEVEIGLQQLINKNLAVELISGNKMEYFLKVITELNINFHNSILVSREPDVIEPFLENYKPLNRYNGHTNYPDKPFCFSVVFWSSIEAVVEKSDTSISSTNCVPYKLAEIIGAGNHIYSSGRFPFMTDKIIYIEDTHDVSINNFITENIKWIQLQAKEKGCSFVYFSKLAVDAQLTDFFAEYIDYHYPDNHADFISDFLTFQQQLPPSKWTELLLDLLDLPAFNTPALLRNRGSIFGEQLNEYSFLALDGKKNIKSQFENYFKNLQAANDTSNLYFSLAENPKRTADDKFTSEASQLMEDIIQKIEYLKANGMHSLLAEIALRIYSNHDQMTIDNTTKSGQKLEIRADVSPVISRLRVEWVSKYDFQILLPDYGNMIVDMPSLPKALYYFFLKHPEGVMLNSLADYKGELLHIYQKISNKGDKEEIIKNIDRLIDPLDNSINVNCSRIKSAFVKLIDDRLAKHYYITGWRGEVKRITLNPELLEIINLF